MTTILYLSFIIAANLYVNFMFTVSKIKLFFFGSEEILLSPDGNISFTAFFQVHLYLLMAESSLANEVSTVKHTSVIWLEAMINHLHHPHVIPDTH